jgi:uncharacterized protein YdeI (YjbR/CyaY-like superfamily)
VPESSSNKADQYYAADRASWRQWLVHNHAASRGVWLVYDKAVAGKRRLSYDDIIDEAVSFGWIDSLTRSLDAERAMLYFSPRKPKSPWSRSNKERVARLVKERLMTEAGLAIVEAAKSDGSWDVYDAVEQLAIPSDLEAALADDKAAGQNFAAFSASNKKQLLWYVASAKRPETRQKRIAQIVHAAAQNKNPLA